MDTETLIGLQHVASEYPHIMEILKRECEELRPLRDVSQERYELAFQELIYRVWKERWKDRKPLGKEEFFWWLSLMMITNSPESIRLRNIKVQVEADWEGFCEKVEQEKQDGVLPSDMTPEEFLAVIFDFPEMTTRPGHPYLQALGFKSTEEWLKRGGIHHLVHSASLIRSGEIRRVTKAVFFGLRRAFQNKGSAPEDSISFDVYSEKVSVADVIGELDMKYSLNQIISASELSPMETLIVDGWRHREIPLPGEKARYGQVKSFCAENNIPHKDFYVVSSRAMTKLEQKAAEVR